MEFKNNAQYQAKLANTLKPAEVVPSDYCGMYYAERSRRHVGFAE